MLVVVKRYIKARKVDILDTDDMCVEQVDFDYANSLDLPISGLYLKQGVEHHIVYRSNIDACYSQLDKSSMLTKFDNIKAYFSAPVFEDYGNVAEFVQHDYVNSIRFSVEYVMNALNTCPIGLILVMGVVYGITGVFRSPDIYSLMVNNKPYRFEAYNIDSFMVLLFAVLYERRYGDETFDVQLLTRDNRNVAPPFDRIYNNSAIFAYDDEIYFCDNMACVSIKQEILDSVLNIKQKEVLNTKHTMMNTNMTVDMASGDYIVHDCDSLVIKDAKKTYVFTGNTDIHDLKITNPKANIKFKAPYNFNINNFYCVSNKGIISKFTKKLALGEIKSYKVSKNAVDFAFISKLADFSIKRAIEYDLVDLNTSDEMLSFVDRVFGSGDEMQKLARRDAINQVTYGKLILVRGMHAFQLLPDSIRGTLNPTDYRLMSAHDFVNTYVQRYSYLETRDLYSLAYNSFRSYNNLYALSTTVERFYNNVKTDLDKRTKFAKEIYDVAQVKAHIRDNVFVAPIVLTSIQENVDCTSMEEYHNIIDFSKKLWDVIDRVVDKFNIKLKCSVVNNNSKISLLIKAFIIERGVLLFPSQNKLARIKNFLAKEFPDITFAFEGNFGIVDIMEEEVIWKIKLDSKMLYKYDDVALFSKVDVIDFSGMNEEEFIRDGYKSIKSALSTYNPKFNISITGWQDAFLKQILGNIYKMNKGVFLVDSKV